MDGNTDIALPQKEIRDMSKSTIHRGCSIDICHNTYVNAEERGLSIRFFRFPKYIATRRAWIEVCHRKDRRVGSGTDKVCSAHFTDEDYKDAVEARLKGETPTKLKKKAVPSLLISPREPKVKLRIKKPPQPKTKERNSLIRRMIAEMERKNEESPLACRESRFFHGSLRHIKRRPPGEVNRANNFPFKHLFRQTAPEATITKPLSPSALEPNVIIKEEPIDIEVHPESSALPQGNEFILPDHSDNSWSSSKASSAATSSLDPSNTPHTSGDTRFVYNADQPYGTVLVKTSPGTSDYKSAATGFKSSAAGSLTTSAAGNSSAATSVVHCSNGEDSKEKDQFDAFAEYIAAKLRQLDHKSCVYAQKAISDILFDAEMGKFK